MSTRAIICIGSNVADKLHIVGSMLDEFASILGGFEASAVYVNDDDSQLGLPYANAVCAGHYNGSLAVLTEFAHQRERDFGRTPLSKPSGVMPLDIDVVICNGEILNSEQFCKPYFQQGFRQLSNFYQLCLTTHKS